MSNFREWDGRSDGLRVPSRVNRGFDVRSDVLVEADRVGSHALSDYAGEQHRLVESTATFDGQLFGMQKRHEEELEAIRERYRRHESTDTEDLLEAKSREQEGEIVRLQQEFGDLLRSREEELEQVIGKLREEATGKSKQLQEIERDYKSLVRAHQEIERQFKDAVEARKREEDEESAKSEQEYGLQPCQSPKDAIVKFVRDPESIFVMVNLLVEAYVTYRKGDEESGDELITLGVGLLVSVTVGIAGRLLLDMNFARTALLIEVAFFAILTWSTLVWFVIEVVNGGSGFIEILFESALPGFLDQCYAMWRDRNEILLAFGLIFGWAMFCRGVFYGWAALRRRLNTTQRSGRPTESKANDSKFANFLGCNHHEAVDQASHSGGSSL